MKSVWKLAVTLACIATACNAYNLNDLPAGWGVEITKIQGTLLPVYASDATGNNPPSNDPNTWFHPIGAFNRAAETNKWVSRIEWVSTDTTAGVSVFHDPNTGYSTHWTLDGWVLPGCNYKVLDAWTWKGRGGQEKKERFTVFTIGYVPLEAIPLLY